MEGTQVGAYRILSQIGEGGMGSVWMAEHTMLGRKAAVKLLHDSFSTRQDIVQRFFNEARAATSISDPGIVQIFDFGHRENGQAYIVMEMLEGEALDRRLQRQGKLAVNDAMRIMRQVASSLGAAHARGIVHRDLKPENIFMVRDPEVIGGERAKILDFGIAKLGEQSGVKTQTNALMGTPSYMSPEQCRGSGAVDARSDVYALGCVFFSLVTGLPPFVAEGHGELIVMHITQPAPLISSRAAHVPATLDALVARCLDKDPAARFANGTELAGALGALLSSVSQVPLAAPAAETIPGPNANPTANTTGVGGEQTTLGGAAAAKSVLTTTDGKPRKLLIGALVGLAAIGGAVTVLSLSGGKDKPAEVAAAGSDGAGSDTATPAQGSDSTVGANTGSGSADTTVAGSGDTGSADTGSAAAGSADAGSAAVTPPEVEQVSIVIESRPRGAQVFVGDEKKARGVTPYTIEVKKSDPAFQIKLVQRGYTTQTKTVTPASDTKLELELVKVKKAGGGTTRPAGGGGGGDDSDNLANPFAKKKN